jgi:hypothetical protein
MEFLSKLIFAHVTDIPHVEVSSLPVLGSPTVALIGAIIIAVGLITFFLFMDRLPRSSGQQLNKISELKLLKLMIVFVMLSIFGTGWDIWWHRAIGRDTFWELPHMMLYSFAILSILVGLYIWRHTREKIWKKIAFALILVPLSAPFDNFWHTIFGVEDLSNPMLLSWSPPHALLALSAMVAIGLLYRELTKFRKDPDFLFYGSACLAAILSGGLFLIMPFHPTEGWGQVLGFVGAGVLAFWFISMLMIAQRTLRSNVSASYVIVFFCVLLLTTYGKETSSQILILLHDRPPIWLLIFAYLTLAAILDLTKHRLSDLLRAPLAALIWAVMLFGTSTVFFEPLFQYGWMDISVAALASILGGILAALVLQLWQEKRDLVE